MEASIVGQTSIVTIYFKQNPTILDKFNTLTVSLPRDEYRISYTLEDLMLQSLKPIQVHDVNCDGCFKKFNKAMMSSFVKYTAIGRVKLTSVSIFSISLKNN